MQKGESDKTAVGEVILNLSIVIPGTVCIALQQLAACRSSSRKKEGVPRGHGQTFHGSGFSELGARGC